MLKKKNEQNEDQKNQSPKSSNNDEKKKFNFKFFLLGALIFLFALSLISSLRTSKNGVKEVIFSELIQLIEAKQVQSIVINNLNSSVYGKLRDGMLFNATILNYPGLIEKLRESDTEIAIKSQDNSLLINILVQLLPFIIIIGIWFFIFRQAQGVNNQALSFGKSKAKYLQKEGQKKYTFKDVGGIGEAVEELQEIVDFLKKPEKFIKIGAKIPKGVLLMGSPGTGKTLLAKAIAGESEASFFTISASEFVEMFVGVGASRVRDLFNKAQKNQPSIIFIDEIDAVGRHRGAGLGGGHDEREQTLNQLLVEMDGFDEKSSVIVIAATNRPDILDNALLRPGRFDRQITIDKPDIKGRLEILEIQKKEKKLNRKVDLEVLAKRTAGFTGADLANLVNEGALLSARRNKRTIGMKELEESIDRIIAGPEKKSKVMDEKDKKIIAFHELGHALVAKLLKGTDPVHKISILPRGMALGYTLQLPEKDKFLVSKQELQNEVTILMGGRCAEEIYFSEITTGASNDIQRATNIANNMVCEYGMSKLGNRIFGKNEQNVFLGKTIQDHTKDYSEETARLIDGEITDIIDSAYSNAYNIIKDNKEKMEKIATILLEKEILEGNEFEELLGETV